ncbi:hypothetical protein AMTRI_Chr04g244360 [Amborella trichopoda]
MGLQWVILSYVVAAEAAVALFLTLPSPSIIKSRIVSLVSLILQPALGIVPFAGFQLMDIYWKQEHRLMCTSETCTAAERDRYEKSLEEVKRDVGEVITTWRQDREYSEILWSKMGAPATGERPADLPHPEIL